MTDILSRLNGGEFLGLCGIMLGLIATIGGISVAIAKVVSDHYRKTQLAEMEATLKVEMIQRGMSAGDIKQVLEAKMGASKPASLQEYWANPWLQCSKRGEVASAGGQAR